MADLFVYVGPKSKLQVIKYAPCVNRSVPVL